MAETKFILQLPPGSITSWLDTLAADPELAKAVAGFLNEDDEDEEEDAGSDDCNSYEGCDLDRDEEDPDADLDSLDLDDEEYRRRCADRAAARAQND